MTALCVWRVWSKVALEAFSYGHLEDRIPLGGLASSERHTGKRRIPLCNCYRAADHHI